MFAWLLVGIIGIILIIGILNIKFLYEEIQSYYHRFDRIDTALDRIIKRVSLLHNSKTGRTDKLLAWLTPEEREKTKKLQEESPELFSFVVECMKLFLYTEQGNDKSN